MAYVAIQAGELYPQLQFAQISAANAVMDAATEKFAMIGRLYIAGRPAGTKTLSTGNIQFRTGAVTFANGSTTLDVGIQDVATGTGPIARPDGTFDVKRTLTGGGGLITANAWTTVTVNSGTKSMAHGDLIAIVFDMTARSGADTVSITASNTMHQTTYAGGQMPVTNAFVSSAWQTTNAAAASRIPNGIITFDDGTLGWIDSTIPASPAAIETFQDSTNPDERGMIFQIPWNSYIDALWALLGPTDAASEFTIKIYSDPTGTPALIASQTVLAENLGVVAVQGMVLLPITEVELARNTDYVVSVLATGTSNVRLYANTLGDTAHRVAITGGTTLKKATRNNSTGAFTAESPAVTIYQMGVRVSQRDDGTGAGSGGMLVHPGMHGRTL